VDVGYDPIKLTENVKRIISKEENNIELRKYYRFRGGRWYGGIATADCVGCNLRCKFCWSWRVRDRATLIGKFYTPQLVVQKLFTIIRRRNYRQVRISGGEPTLTMKHLIQVLEILESEAPRVLFILETNGIILGAYKEYARELSKFNNIHVRVSLKGCNEEEFHMLTGAKPGAFQLQLKALENLLNAGVSTHPAVMLSFSSENTLRSLLSRLAAIDKILVKEFEEEYVFLYPHVKELLKRYGLKPKVAFRPNSIPEELI